MRAHLAVGALCAAFLAIYLPDAGHGFIKDDFGWILNSRSSGLGDVLQLFASNVGFYRPLVSASFAADHALWGLQPFGYAVTNLLLCASCAGLLYMLARRFALPAAAALLAAGVWAFNFHGVNMALLWISGRTSLLVTLFSLATSLAVMAGARLAAGLLCLAALFSKEEAVLLPLLLTAFLWTGASGSAPDRLRSALASGWTLWLSLGIYGGLRLGSGAFGPLDAPEYYRFSASPVLVVRNVIEYADRSGTVAAAAAILLLVAARRARPQLEPHERRAILFAGIWMLCTFALTIWLPVRSSLYALLPSAGAALAAAALASWAIRVNPSGFRTLAVCLPILVLLLIPVYRSRNVRWVAPADISTRVMTSVQRHAGNETGGRIVLVDAPGERFNLDAAFGGLFTEAVTLVLGPRWIGEIVAPGEPLPADARLTFQFDHGQIVPVPRTPGAIPD